MELKTQRRLASKILKVGENRVWIDPEEIEAVSSAVTKEDIRKLIYDRIIQAKQKEGISSHRTKKRRLQRLKGRQKEHGSRRGKWKARISKKKIWVSKIRPIRKKLKELRDSKSIDKTTYRAMYRMAKSGVFKDKAHVEHYLKENELLRK